MQQQNMNLNQDITGIVRLQTQAMEFSFSFIITGLIMNADRQKRSEIMLTEQLKVYQLMQADSTLRLRQSYTIRATVYCFYINIKCMSNTT
jgi:hypothetical protein